MVYIENVCQSRGLVSTNSLRDLVLFFCLFEGTPLITFGTDDVLDKLRRDKTTLLSNSMFVLWCV